MKKARVKAVKARSRTAKKAVMKLNRDMGPDVLRHLTKAWCRPSELHARELHTLKFKIMRAMAEFQRDVGQDIGRPILVAKARQIARNV